MGLYSKTVPQTGIELQKHSQLGIKLHKSAPKMGLNSPGIPQFGFILSQFGIKFPELGLNSSEIPRNSPNFPKMGLNKHAGRKGLLYVLACADSFGKGKNAGGEKTRIISLCLLTVEIEGNEG